MSKLIKIAKWAARHDVESKVQTAHAKLRTAKAFVDSAVSIAEFALIGLLLTKRQALDQKLNEIKETGETTYQQTKADVEARVAALEQSIQAIEAKFKAA